MLSRASRNSSSDGAPECAGLLLSRSLTQLLLLLLLQAAAAASAVAVGGGRTPKAASWAPRCAAGMQPALLDGTSGSGARAADSECICRLRARPFSFSSAALPWCLRPLTPLPSAGMLLPAAAAMSAEHPCLGVAGTSARAAGVGGSEEASLGLPQLRARTMPGTPKWGCCCPAAPHSKMLLLLPPAAVLAGSAGLPS